MDIETKFVKELKECVVEDNLCRYENYLSSVNIDDIKSDDWRLFVSVIREKGLEKSASVVFRQIFVDSLANVLGVLDGSSNLNTMRGDIFITYDGIALDKTLADIFWEDELN